MLALKIRQHADEYLSAEQSAELDALWNEERDYQENVLDNHTTALDEADAVASAFIGQMLTDGQISALAEKYHIEQIVVWP